MARVKRYLRLLVKQTKKEQDIASANERRTELIETAVTAFHRWVAQSSLKVIATEVSLACDNLRFAGTLDGAAVEVHGRLALADWKTSGGVYWDYLPQVAAYTHLVENGRQCPPPSGRPRYKDKDGIAIPGTTTITGRYKDSEALKYWAWSQGIEGRDYKETMEKAADVGTEVHKHIEKHFNSITDLPGVDAILGRRVEECHLLRFDKTWGSFSHHMWPRPVIDEAMMWFRQARQMYELEKGLKKAV